MSLAATLYVAVARLDTPLVGVTAKLTGHVMEGGDASIIIMLIEQLLELFALSVAVQLTVVVVCTVKRVPDAGHTMDAIPEPSVAVTLVAKLTTGSGRLSEAKVVYETLPGQLKTGFNESVIVTVNEHELDSMALSTAVQFTVVVPRPNEYGLIMLTDGKHERLFIPLPEVALAEGV